VVRPTTVYSSTAYGPFGEQYGTSGTTDASFTGQDQDTISTLYDFLARRYSPSQGRWVSPDPAGRAAVKLTNPQTWNRYVYVLNNPLRLVDPKGMDECDSEGDDDDSAAAECSVDSGGGGGGDSSGDGSGDDGGNGDCPADACVTAPPPDDVNTMGSNINPCTAIFAGVNDVPDSPGFADAGAETNGKVFFPLPGSGYSNLVSNAAVAAGYGGFNNAQSLANSVNDLADAGNTSITGYFYSGSAGLFQQAWNAGAFTEAAVSAMKAGGINFIEPGGMSDATATFDQIPTHFFIGQSQLNSFVQGSNVNIELLKPPPTVLNVQQHNFGMAWNTPQIQRTIPLSGGCLEMTDNKNSLPTTPDGPKPEGVPILQMTDSEIDRSSPKQNSETGRSLLVALLSTHGRVEESSR
jgi:RHS repeat-associated protein